MFNFLRINKNSLEDSKFDIIENFLKLIDARIDCIKGQLTYMDGYCPYNKLCTPGHHFWTSHNRERIPNERICLCGKEVYKLTKK